MSVHSLPNPPVVGDPDGSSGTGSDPDRVRHDGSYIRPGWVIARDGAPERMTDLVPGTGLAA